MSQALASGKIGSLELKNRLLMAPVKTAFGGLDAKVTAKLLAYYRRRAAGGAAAIVVEPLFVDSAGKEHPRQLGVDEDDKVEGLARLVEAIHSEGSLAVAHLNHAGRAANPKASGKTPEAPSALPCASTGAQAEAMPRERIQEVVEAFRQAARRVREAGFDALEVQSGLGYLLAQFLSPATNHRTDEYGGDEHGRRRFVGEVLGAVREGAGGLPTWVRMSATEHTRLGLTLEDGKALAQWLQDQGAAALHVVSGSACDTPPWYFQHMSMPPGVNAELAREIKQVVDIPVIAAGRMGDPEEMERVLGEGWADFVALGRPLVADPDIPRKLAEGHPELVLRCGACLQGCLMGVKSGQGIQCIVNPELGRESEPVQPVEVPKRVVVVGAGPAGLTAARVAARRGHRVVLLERSRERLGGQFALAHLAPGKQRLKKVLDSLVTLTEHAGAGIERGVEADVSHVLSRQPDVVVVATGAVPVIPNIPGLENPLTGEDVLTGRREPGTRVLIIGGGLVGVEAAEYLVSRGREVTIVEMLQDIARDMEPVMRKLTLKRLPTLAITVLTETVVTELHPDGTATVRQPSGERTIGPFDDVVVAVGTRPRDELSEKLRQAGVEVHVVGDALETAQVFGAVQSAWKVARSL